MTEPILPFSEFLAARELELTRSEALTLQVNIGLRCNQSCRHCHLEAGPARHELMDMAVAEEVFDFARRNRFSVIDITGGAPELHPGLPQILENLAPLAPELILRSNLTLIGESSNKGLIDICRENRITIVSSFPSPNKAQSESLRGKETFEKLVAALRLLNSEGYGHAGSGLKLNLVSNPAGAFLPASQDQVERKFRRDLEKNWGIVFTNLYTFGNMPLGRFRHWLVQTGNEQAYMKKLAASFNPCTIPGLMCRSLVSISWDGYLYDCDFNQAANIPLGGKKLHISETEHPPLRGSPIAVGEHCYACTAGSGFT
ncbi:MAG: arsenosugar biosynthesis radical SAM (seleno)protein ArsS [Syntrophobacter sp.]